MAKATVSSRNFRFEMRRDVQTMWTDLPSPNEHWRETDENGHEHYYDTTAYEHYPTLNFVIDAQHWCLGNEGLYAHDPHWAVDESHYECKLCGLTVEPKIDPPGKAFAIAGPVEAELSGRAHGGTLRIWLTSDEIASLQNASESERDAVAAAILEGAPQSRWISLEIAPR